MRKERRKEESFTAGASKIWPHSPWTDVNCPTAALLEHMTGEHVAILSLYLMLAADCVNTISLNAGACFPLTRHAN